MCVDYSRNCRSKNLQSEWCPMHRCPSDVSHCHIRMREVIPGFGNSVVCKKRFVLSCASGRRHVAQDETGNRHQHWSDYLTGKRGVLKQFNILSTHMLRANQHPKLIQKVVHALLSTFWKKHKTKRHTVELKEHPHSEEGIKYSTSVPSLL